MVLEVKNLFKSINKKEILFDINFSAHDKDIIGFIGNNGAGKTTTIKCIFQEYQYNKGQIIVNNHTINGADLKQIAFFPDQNNFPKNYRIYDYCKYNYKLSGFKDKKEFTNYFNELMDALDLKEQKKAKFKELSAGMQKRALLVSILITKPKLIILDEPTANLDVASRQDFISLLKMLAVKKGIIILITSHNIEELDTFINKVVIINEGKILLEQSFNNKNQNLTKIYNQVLKNTKQKIDKNKIEEFWENE